jgi:segregation and condensation protein B
MAFSLHQVLKALLFSTSQPLSIKDIQAAFARFHEQANGVEEPLPGEEAPAGDETEVSAEVAPVESDGVPRLVTAAQIREAMDELARALREGEEVFLLIEGAQGYRLVTHPRFAPWVRSLRNEPPPARLSQSALETLAIVAYRQPVTRSEIEAIRGVSADAGLNKLIERELVYVTGRAELPGRPLQYGTTDKFLEFVGVKSLVELPASDVLSPRQIDEWLRNAMNPTTPGDVEMGLPLEPGEGDTPMQDEPSAETPAAGTEAGDNPESAPEPKTP